MQARQIFDLCQILGGGHTQEIKQVKTLKLFFADNVTW